jgi:outer membrane usher protein FimD/PapC
MRRAKSFLPGAAARIGDIETVVGWDGLLFIEDLGNANEIIVALPGGPTCRAALGAPTSATARPT